jgi:hypothetical protein
VVEKLKAPAGAKEIFVGESFAPAGALSSFSLSSPMTYVICSILSPLSGVEVALPQLKTRLKWCLLAEIHE